MSSLTLRSVSSLDELERVREDWRKLGENAELQNLFYEPDFLVSAIRNLPPIGERALFLFFFDDSNLVGFFPIKRRKHFHGTPYDYFVNWDYVNCYLSNPLVLRGYELAVIHKTYEFLNSQDQSGSKVMVWGGLRSDSSFCVELEAYLSKHSDEFSTLASATDRGLYWNHGKSDEHFENRISKKHRKEYSRIERRLSEEGEVSFEFNREAQSEKWQEYLELEALGWKGESQTAILHREGDRKFFESVIESMTQGKRFVFAQLKLNERVVAMGVLVSVQSGLYFLKIAFHPEYEKFSPGTLLSKKIIRELDALPEYRWLDSCASPNHSMAERIIGVGSRICTFETVRNGKGPGLVLKALGLKRKIESLVKKS